MGHRSVRGFRKAQLRRGFSLLEAILATGLFAGAMAVLIPAADRGAAIALRMQMESLAALECQRVLAETLLQLPTEPKTNFPSAVRNEQWITTVTVDDSSWQGIAKVTAKTESIDPTSVVSYELTQLAPNFLATRPGGRVERE